MSAPCVSATAFIPTAIACLWSKGRYFAFPRGEWQADITAL
jgi:hypothetical protein